MQLPFQSTPFSRSDGVAAPSSPASLTAALLLHAGRSNAPMSPLASLPSAGTADNWRSRAVSILRGRADVRGKQQFGDAASAPLRAAPPGAYATLVSRIDSPGTDAQTLLSGEQKIRRLLETSANTAQATAPIYLAANAANAANNQPDRAVAPPLSQQARRMTGFLAEADGPHRYLNLIRGTLRMRQQQVDSRRYLDDVLLDRWIAEYTATLLHPAADNLSAAVADALEDTANWQFKRLATRLIYLDTPSLPAVSDAAFAEFAERYAQHGGPRAVQQRFAEFCQTRRAQTG